MAQALGVRFLDERGREIAGGGLALARTGARRRHADSTGDCAGVTCVAATDVDNPLTGPAGASAVYGPQKGASPDDVVVLDRALAHLAAVVARDIGVDLRDEPGAGAAGGLGFGLMAFLGAHVRPGVDVVADALGLHARMAAADLAITGEGRLDGGSLRGKVPAGILGLGRELSVPVAIVCGDAEAGLPLDGVTVVSLVERFGRDEALGDARRSLERLAQELAARADELVGPGRGGDERRDRPIHGGRARRGPRA